MRTNKRRRGRLRQTRPCADFSTQWSMAASPVTTKGGLSRLIADMTGVNFLQAAALQLRFGGISAAAGRKLPHPPRVT